MFSIPPFPFRPNPFHAFGVVLGAGDSDQLHGVLRGIHANNGAGGRRELRLAQHVIVLGDHVLVQLELRVHHLLAEKARHLFVGSRSETGDGDARQRLVLDRGKGNGREGRGRRRGVRSFVLWMNNGNKSHREEITLLGSEGVYGKLAVDRVTL